VRSVGALLVFALVPYMAHAAPPEPARDRARTYLMLRLVDALDLPDDKALVLRTIFARPTSAALPWSRPGKRSTSSSVPPSAVRRRIRPSWGIW